MESPQFQTALKMAKEATATSSANVDSWLLVLFIN